MFYQKDGSVCRFCWLQDMKCVSGVIRKSHFNFSITENNKAQFYHIIVSGNFLRHNWSRIFQWFQNSVFFLYRPWSFWFSDVFKEDKKGRLGRSRLTPIRGLSNYFGWASFVLKIEFQGLKVTDQPCESMFIGIVSGVKEGCVCCKLSLSLAFIIFVQPRPDCLFPSWQLHVQS